ncbi:putative membrane protein [Halapricum desulfuricans]|uniref:Putative membrane protein n=1 Tax=Halapricum desulfuricans TaxID=2841257 RepID=A0A897NHI8_9EURY|nr:hypothetical protein [Halapricum desulfuricans]QSG12192.1 putative membrane protein [Halapricum desulfuricans]
MDFDALTTAVAFVALIAVGVGGASMSPMSLETTLVMVLPSAVVFGAIVLVLGVKHGEYRARNV